MRLLHRILLGTALVSAAFLTAGAPLAADEATPTASAVRLAANPMIRPEMMPKDDGDQSESINFPSLIRVPAWIDKPLGKYYLYFSAHHGTYIRLAYADRVEGPWKIHEEGTLRLTQVEAVNRSPPVAGPVNPLSARHVASPDVHVDDARKQIRMYFHYMLPKLGHSSTVATSTDGLKFEPMPGRIAGPYLRVIRRGNDYLAIDQRGEILASPDGIEPFKPVSDVIIQMTGFPPAAAHYRNGGGLLEGDSLNLFFTRTGDAPERIFFSQVKLGGDPQAWRALPAAVVLEPKEKYEGVAAPIAPSTPLGQRNVRQLRDPCIFKDEGRTWLLYAVAGESGIAIAEVVIR